MNFFYSIQDEGEEEVQPREAELYEFDNCSKGLGNIRLY